MNSKGVLYSPGKNDECYTPRHAVLPILEFIPPGATVWCPFDTWSSWFHICIKAAGWSVVKSHIYTGEDFFDYEPVQWDVMVSNPPFTQKRRYFERALDLGKPFALLMSNTWLNDAAPKQIFMDRGRDLQLLMFDRRIHFERNGQVDKKTTFSSSYFCCDFLPQQIVLWKLRA